MADTGERIGETGWFTAYMRTFSDIPFSSEIFRELQRIVNQTRSAEQRQQLERLKDREWAPKFEARFKIINRLLKEFRADQILEVAAGFSPRGLAMASDPTITYVEMDLPGATREKRRIAERLTMQSNVHFKEGDVRCLPDLMGATPLFAAKPIAIVCEGLLRFLDLRQTETVAKNVHEVLARFGGVWIWSDSAIGKKADVGLGNAMIRKQEEQISKITGIDVTKLCFENAESAIAFYERVGFAVERRALTEVSGDLVSPKRLGLSAEQVEKMIEKETVFITRLR